MILNLNMRTLLKMTDVMFISNLDILVVKQPLELMGEMRYGVKA